MEALVAGSNMLWLLRQILSNWVDTFILAGDAQIPLHWVLSENSSSGIEHKLSKYDEAHRWNTFIM